MEPKLSTCFVSCRQARQVVTHPGEIKKKLDGWTHVGADGETHVDPNINKDIDRKRRGRHPDAETKHAPRQLAFAEAGVAKLTR